MSTTPRLDAATTWRVAVDSWQARGCVGDFPDIDWPVEPEASDVQSDNACDQPPPPLWLVPRTPPPHEALKLMHFNGRIRRGRQMLTKGLLRAGALAHRPRLPPPGVNAANDDTNPPTEESA